MATVNEEVQEILDTSATPGQSLAHYYAPHGVIDFSQPLNPFDQDRLRHVVKAYVQLDESAEEAS